MTDAEAIQYNKNLREYMKITDKTSEYKFLKENYEALDMAIKALEDKGYEQGYKAGYAKGFEEGVVLWLTTEKALIKVKGYLTDHLPLDCANEIDEIIEALKQQPSDDCISRAEALKEIENEKQGWELGETRYAIDECHTRIAELPSVTPQPKIGHWEYVQYDSNPNIGNWHCSECRGICTEMHSIEDAYNYCPNCGAKIEVAE